MLTLRRAKSIGFTLMEVLLVITLIGMIAAFAIPSYQSFYEKQNAELTKMQLLRAIEFARSSALIQQEPVTLCGSSDLETCSGQWEKCLLIKTKNKILFSFQSPALKGKIQWRAFPNLKPDLIFLADGFSATENGTFNYYEKNSPNPLWAISINQAGRAHVTVTQV